jgi:hypothetical protein
MRFVAPVVTNPGDGTPYTGGDDSAIYLTWESVGSLAADEEYVVYVGRVLADGGTEWILTDPHERPFQELSWRVPVWIRGLGIQESGWKFLWYVQVERVSRDEVGSVIKDAEGISIRTSISPPSDVRGFSWQ